MNNFVHNRITEVIKMGDMTKNNPNKSSNNTGNNNGTGGNTGTTKPEDCK